MKKFILTLCIIAFPFLPANAEERGTKEEAIDIVKKVEAFFNEKGADETFKAVTEKTNTEFFYKDLYPFIYDLTGKNVAHGVKPHLVGKDLIKLKDQGGKELIREMADLAKTGKSGWVDYKWPEPNSNAISDKTSYIIPLGNKYFVGVGIYK